MRASPFEPRQPFFLIPHYKKESWKNGINFVDPRRDSLKELGSFASLLFFYFTVFYSAQINLAGNPVK